MKIAHIGLRGIPAQYGGIEVFVEEVATRLKEKGWDVYVYSRRSNSCITDLHKGVHIVNLPTIKIRRFETTIHSIISALHAIGKKVDLIHLHGYMSYFVIPLLKICGKRVVITLHGAAWENISYGVISRFITKFAAVLGILLADGVTAVSLPLKDELSKKYKRNIVLTPIGVQESNRFSTLEILSKYDLMPDEYILFLGRLEKVKRIDWLIRAYLKIEPNYKLVIAGDSNERNYKNYIKNLARFNKNIIFTGYVKGRLKDALLSNCRFFVLPSIIEGMPVSILEAISYEKACLASDIPVHKWLIEDLITGYLFKTNDFDDFVKKLKILITLDIETIKEMGRLAYASAQNRFNWDETVSQLSLLYCKIKNGGIKEY